MKGGWIQKRKKEDSGPVVEEEDDVESEEEEEERLSVVTQYGSSLSSSHRQPSSQHHMTEVPDSQELPASQDVIESSHQNSFLTPSHIPEESADELFARAMSAMHSPEPAASYSATPQTQPKSRRGRKRKSPEREDPPSSSNAESHMNLVDVYKPRPVEYKFKTALVKLPNSRNNSQTEEVEEEVEDVEEEPVNVMDEEDDEFVPGTQEQEDIQKLFVNGSAAASSTASRQQQSKQIEDEVEDISDDDDQSFGRSPLPDNRRLNRTPWLSDIAKGKERIEEDDIQPDSRFNALEQEGEDDFGPLSLPTPMFPTPPVLVNIKREEDIEQDDSRMLMDDEEADQLNEEENIEDEGREEKTMQEDDDIEAEADERQRKLKPSIKLEEMEEFSEESQAIIPGESSPQLPKRFLFGRRQPLVPDVSPSGPRFLHMIKTPEKDTQSLGGAIPGIAPRRLVPSGMAMRLARIVERYVSRTSAAPSTLPSMLPAEAQPSAPTGISIHLLSLKPQAGLTTASAVILPPTSLTLDEAVRQGWKPEQVSVVFSKTVTKALELNIENTPALHIQAPWQEVIVGGRRVILTGNCGQEQPHENLEDILCLLASTPAPAHNPAPHLRPQVNHHAENLSQASQPEDSADEIGVASQSMLRESNQDTRSKKSLSLQSFVPVGTTMPSFTGMVQRAHILAFPPTKSSLDVITTPALSLKLNELYSATLLVQDMEQNLCLIHIPAAYVPQWQDMVLSGEGRAYRFSNLTVVASCLASRAIKEQGIASLLASIGADKRGGRITLLTVTKSSLANEEDDADEADHTSKAQLKSQYKLPQTHILRNVVPLLYQRGSPDQISVERRLSIVCRLVAKTARDVDRGPRVQTSSTTLFVTDPSLPSLGSGQSSPASTYLIRVEMPRCIPHSAIDSLLPVGSLLYISHLLLRAEGDSVNGPALVVDHFTCIKRACHPQEGPTTWLEEAESSESPRLPSQAFPDEAINALEQLHFEMPTLDSFYGPVPHPLPLPSLHKGAIVRLTGTVAEVVDPGPVYDACDRCNSQAERREGGMGEWWFCSTCMRMLPSPVRRCRLSLLVTPTPPLPPAAPMSNQRLRLEVEHDVAEVILGIRDTPNIWETADEHEWAARVDALAGLRLSAECVLRSSGMSSPSGESPTLQVLRLCHSS